MQTNAERRRGNCWDPKMNAGTGWGEFLVLRQDALQEGVERNRGTCRY